MNIPVLTVSGPTLAYAYEAAMFELYRNGVRFKTQYDKEGDPLSIDATMNITIENPLAEPMVHKCFPGGPADMKEYVMELGGVKDHWVKNMNDPKDTRWEYTYHGRLANWGRYFIGEHADIRLYGGWLSDPASGKGWDQIDYVIDKLCEQPFGRQAQMITWMPPADLDCYDPPCLQSLWFRIIEDEAGIWWLNTNIRFRSNDAWGAHFMNVFGFTMFIKDVIAAGVSRNTGKDVRLGRINWQADSFHIYGKDIAMAEKMLFGRLYEPWDKPELTMMNFSGIFEEIYNEAEPSILAKIKEVDMR